MAEVNAKDLTTKTAPASTDSMLLFGTSTNEGAKITVDNLANNILERLTTKTFANQVGGSSAATILAQLATLNSNKVSNETVHYISMSTDILTAIEDAGGGIIVGTCSGTNYTGKSPNNINSYKYGSFICMKRHGNAITLLWLPETIDDTKPIYVLSRTSSGWTNCLPLTYGNTVPLV